MFNRLHFSWMAGQQQNRKSNTIAWWSFEEHRKENKLNKDPEPKEKPPTTQAPRDYK